MRTSVDWPELESTGTFCDAMKLPALMAAASTLRLTDTVQPRVICTISALPSLSRRVTVSPDTLINVPENAWGCGEVCAMPKAGTARTSEMRRKDLRTEMSLRD